MSDGRPIDGIYIPRGPQIGYVTTSATMEKMLTVYSVSDWQPVAHITLDTEVSPLYTPRGVKKIQFTQI